MATDRAKIVGQKHVKRQKRSEVGFINLLTPKVGDQAWAAEGLFYAIQNKTLVLAQQFCDRQNPLPGAAFEIGNRIRSL